MRAWTSSLLVAVALLGAVDLVAVSAHAADCTFAGRTRVRLGTRGQSSADLAVNDALGRAQIGRGATLADDTTVTADLLGLNNGASVFDVSARLMQAGRGVTIRGDELDEPTLPLDPDFCEIASVSAGGAFVQARRGDDPITLQPGSYGAVELQNGTTLILAAGTYGFERIKTGWNVSIEIVGSAATTVGVAGDVSFGNRTRLTPEGVGPTPVLRIAGSHVKFGAGSEIQAHVEAPNAGVRLGRRGAITGSLCADAFLTGNEVDLACATDVVPPTTSTTSTTTTTTTTSSTSSSTTTSTAPSTTTSTTATSTTTTEPEPTTTTTSSTTTSTGPSSCGDAFVSGSEECDDGNENAADGCTNDCTVCGNETTTSPELCDDGDLDSGDGCDANCTPTGCGNGVVTSGETCDDGNLDDNDACPATCVIETCTPIVESDRAVQVVYAGSTNVAGLVVLLDYPEGAVSILGSGPDGVNAITDVGGDGFVAANDLDHAIRVVVNSSDGGALPPSQLFTVHFNDCEGANPPPSGLFSCTVLSASAPDLQPVPGVTCAVVIDGETTTTTIATTTSTSTTAPPTTTTSSTTTSTAPPTTSTSTSTTTTSSGPTTTSSSTSSSTTSTSSSSTTTTSSSTTTTTVPLLCGNGTIDAGETCDDGNTNNADACPSDCSIDACTPQAETNLRIAVFFAPPSGGLVAGITLLVDYPEGRVSLPATGDSFPTGVITNTPGGAAVARFDFEHALRMTIGRATALVPSTQLFRANFQTCQGAPPATAQDFGCTVLAASDPFSNPVAGATCSVTIVP